MAVDAEGNHPKELTLESDERREAEDTHPDEPGGNGETASEPYEPEREDVPDETADSKRAEDDPDNRAQEASDDGMGKRTQPRE